MHSYMIDTSPIPPREQRMVQLIDAFSLIAEKKTNEGHGVSPSEDE